MTRYPGIDDEGVAVDQVARGWRLAQPGLSMLAVVQARGPQGFQTLLILTWQIQIYLVFICLVVSCKLIKRLLAT